MSRQSGGEPSENAPNGAPLASRLSLLELQRAVLSADPAALLILPRILRRVIKHDRRLTGFGLRVPHRKGYVIGRDALLQIVEPSELGLDADAALPERVVLLACPTSRRLADSSAQELLLRYWRLLFHARVHLALDAKFGEADAGDGGPSVALGVAAPIIRQRINALGRVAFDEIRTVLAHEDLLLPPRSDLSVYIEFVATYLELRHFAPSILPHYFPGLEDLAAVDAQIREDVDAESLLAATRPAGASDPEDYRGWDEWAEAASDAREPAPDMPSVRKPSMSRYRSLMRKSQRPAALGNLVRVAIWHAKAAQCAPPEMARRAAEEIKADVHRMAVKLQAALELEPTGARPWEESLLALVRQTPRGIWTVEARLLYDLQKACVDHDRDVYTVDLVEWAVSFGRRPIRRRLPAQRDVLTLKHLRSAERRLAAAQITNGHRRQLARLLRDAIRRTETHLREQFRPRIAAVLDDVGLLPQNLPERVARKKLVEELLDRIAERGFLAIGDLRDAISRNNLKLPDIVSPVEFSNGGTGRRPQGDQLLHADRQLALTLDGVYRRGEIYMRAMQRLSSVGFGTAIGRFLTRFLAVPFGGAFVSVVGVVEIWGLFTGPKKAEAAAPGAGHGLELTENQAYIILLLGLFLLGVVNSARFRTVVAGVFRTAYSLFYGLVIEPIRWLRGSPLLRRFLASRFFVVPFRFVVKPALWTAALWWLLWALPPRDRDWRALPVVGASIFLAFNVLLNSRWGRNAEEVLADGIVQGWHRFGFRLVVGVFWFFVDVFRAMLEAVERLIYSVDEWLRFRTGERRSWLAAKALLGALWFFFAYVLRFAVNVLIEPQFNPIKHFPVVTVAHKLLLGIYAPLATLLETTMDRPMAWTVAITIIWCIPGVFGFLVWELKENWRLYAANRRRKLGPVMIGSHGETMGRLLRPGFHSGTAPRRFAKLRLAERRAPTDGDWHSVRKHLHTLEHVERSLRRYVEREFLQLFAESPAWQPPPPRLRAIRLSTNSVRFSMECDETNGEPFDVTLDVESGWLLAGADRLGWTNALSASERQVLSTALLGLYKTCGIELVRQQIEAEFAAPAPNYHVTADGLIVWPNDGTDAVALYPLGEGPWIAPQSVRGLPRRRLPTIERQRIMFSEMAVSWDRWVELWNERQGDAKFAKSAGETTDVQPRS
ncbi:MAG: hypothetical protein ABFC63_06990 [Thermoguttaceae bacterium]